MQKEIAVKINLDLIYEYNKKTADKILSQRKNVVFVKMKKPKISTPKLELVPTLPT